MTSAQLGDRLVRLCADAQNVMLAAPYVKASALSRVLDGVGGGAFVSVITKWTPNDLAIGSSDLRCRAIIKDLGGSFRLHPTIHAKYYRINDEVLVGSANVTSAALGWSTRPNLEILCRPGPDFDAVQFERSLREQSRELSDHEFAAWQQVGDMKALLRERQVSLELPRLENWWPITRDLRNLKLAYRDNLEDIASFDEQRAAQQDLEALAVPKNLSDSEFSAWVTTALYATPFVHAARQYLGVDPTTAPQRASEQWELSITQARRALETVQNWLASLGSSELQKPPNP